MKTRIALAAVSFSLLSAGTAFAGEAPQLAWPELDAPASTAPIARNVTLSPNLLIGEGQVQFPAGAVSPAATAIRTLPAVDVSTISASAQFPWPELERGLNRD